MNGGFYDVLRYNAASYRLSAPISVRLSISNTSLHHQHVHILNQHLFVSVQALVLLHLETFLKISSLDVVVEINP